jgi:hypothetical protein
MVGRQLLTKRTLHTFCVIVILLVVVFRETFPVKTITLCGTTLWTHINLPGHETIWTWSPSPYCSFVYNSTQRCMPYVLINTSSVY